MELTLEPSPSREILLARYDPALFPEFRLIFEAPALDSPLRDLACDLAEADSAVVMENRSPRDVTALRYCWNTTDEDGNQNRHTVSADSYAVDVYHAVLAGGDSKLICRSTAVDKSLLAHVLSGGGRMGSRFSQRPLGPVKALQFEIDFVLFVDGEIVGPDRAKYASDLQCRRPAAEFVAKQIRLAESKGWDIAPVLSAIKQMPHTGNLRHSQGDPLVHWVQRYAHDYLRALDHPKIGTLNMAEARLRHLENRPVLPKFYRRQTAA